MSRTMVTKDLPVMIVVDTEDEDEALAYTDDKWAKIATKIEGALLELKHDTGIDVTPGFFYDDIEVEEWNEA